VRASEAKQLQETTADWNDGLAHPIPYKNPPGKGKDRAIVLGGGSEYMSSFLVEYFHAMLSNGVDLRLADIVVGTSAGAVLGSALLGGLLDLFSAEFNLLADYPKIMAKLVPTKKCLSLLECCPAEKHLVLSTRESWALPSSMVMHAECKIYQR
jgi:NTE family protein